MASPPQPPTTHHAATLSSLTNANPMEPLNEKGAMPHVAFNQHNNQPRSQNFRNTFNHGWVIVRKSRIPPKAWNRQSILVFADFNNFESPHNSQSHRAAERDEDEHYNVTPTSEKENISSSASVYSSEKPEPPYHVFTLAKKKQLVYIVSLAGLFSPLSINIYFPALGQIATVSLFS